jgi:hypothetical protein
MSKYHPNFVPIPSGTVFNSWTIREYVGGGNYHCECICGTTKTIVIGSLKKGYRKACKRCSTGIPKGESGLSEVFSTYRRNAINSGRTFELSKDQARNFFKSNCYYCGEEPISIQTEFKYNGIDRLDNSVGYIVGNCVSCCKICNHMKHVMSLDAFLAHIKRICEHRSL